MKGQRQIMSREKPFQSPIQLFPAPPSSHVLKCSFSELHISNLKSAIILYMAPSPAFTFILQQSALLLYTILYSLPKGHRLTSYFLPLTAFSAPHPSLLKAFPFYPYTLLRPAFWAMLLNITASPCMLPPVFSHRCIIYVMFQKTNEAITQTKELNRCGFS